MKILFVRPKPSAETIGLQHVMVVEPLELEVLATLIEKEHQPTIVDFIVENRNMSQFLLIENPDVVCVTGYITNIPGMIECCIAAKKFNPKIKTIVGGVHCEVCPDDLNHPSIDYRVVRNATTLFPALIKHIQGQADLPNGVLQYGQMFQLSDLPPYEFFFPIPNRAYTRRYRHKYFYIFHNKVALLKTSFGCPYRCKFCFCRKITQDNYYERPLDEVVAEIRHILEKEIYIVDDDFLANRKRVLDFIERNKKHRLRRKYLIYGRADFIANNPDVIEKFCDVGLRTVIVGIESFKDADLAEFGKKTSADTQKKALLVLKRFHVDCYATMIASPDWTKTDFNNTRKELMSLGVHYLNLQPFTPLPGIDIKISEDRLLFPRSDYEKWDLAHVTVRPSKMSVPEYYSEILNIYLRVLYRPKYLLAYLLRYPIAQLWTMFKGSFKIYQQYRQKQKEAELHA